MMTLMFISVMLSLSMLISSNPIMILIVILMQTLMMCLMIWTFMKTSWFSFILFLIFLGGLMVLFVYVVSLASNEKFELNYEELVTLSLVVLTSLTLMTMPSFFNKNFDMLSFNLFDQTMLIFSFEMMTITTLVMSYLLFTLIVAVKISSKYEGPLRNFI